MNRLLPAPQSGIDETKESKIDGQTECFFDMNEYSFLDHIVGDGQIHPDDAKVAAVHQFK